MASYHPVLSTSASALLRTIFQRFEEVGHSYCAMRNYRGYPDKLTGDIDLVVAPDEIPAAVSTVRRAAMEHDWACYVLDIVPYAAHIGLYKPVYPERYALVIELSAGGGWRGMSYLPASHILNQRVRYGITWRPASSHEAILTLVHHLLYNKCVYAKYRREIRALVLDDEQSFLDQLATPCGNRLARLTLKSVLNDDWEALEQRAWSYRWNLIMRSLLRNPFRFTTALFRAYGGFRSKPEGMVFVVSSDDQERCVQICEALLGLAKKWHLFLPPVRKIIYLKSSSSKEMTRTGKLVHQVMSHGGVAIIACAPGVVPQFELSYYPYVVSCDRDGHLSFMPLQREHIKRERAWSTDSPTIPITADSPQSAAYQIWNLALADRTRLATCG